MQRMLFTFVTLIFLSSSCSDNDNLRSNTCSVKDPLEDLPWLKAKVAELRQGGEDAVRYFFISQGTYQNETVFKIDNCCVTCDIHIRIYNCNGEELTDLRGGIEDWEVIWLPWNSRCR